MQLDNIRLLSDRFEEMFLFYRDVLGFQVTWGEANGNYASFVLPGGTIGLSRKSIMTEALGVHETTSQPKIHSNVAFILKVDSVDETYVKLKHNGVDFFNNPKNMVDWGIRVVHFRDPDGNILELFQELPKEQWSQQLRSEDERAHL